MISAPSIFLGFPFDSEERFGRWVANKTIALTVRNSANRDPRLQRIRADRRSQRRRRRIDSGVKVVLQAKTARLKSF
jgi:cytochrome P450